MSKYMKFISSRQTLATQGPFVVEVQEESAPCFSGVVVFSENPSRAVGEVIEGLSLHFFDEISAADLALLKSDSTQEKPKSIFIETADGFLQRFESANDIPAGLPFKIKENF